MQNEPINKLKVNVFCKEPCVTFTRYRKRKKKMTFYFLIERIENKIEKQNKSTSGCNFFLIFPNNLRMICFSCFLLIQIICSLILKYIA